MTVVSVSVLKAKLSECLRRVQAGEEVTVTDRGRVIARIAPVAQGNGPDRARLEEMERQGLVKLAKHPGGIPAEFWQLSAPKVPGSAALAAVLAEREESR